MPRSYLFDICDWHMNYAGCSNIPDLVQWDQSYVWLYVIEIALYFGFLAQRFYTESIVDGRTVKQFFNKMDTLALLMVGFSSLRIYFHIRMANFATLDLASMTDADLETFLRGNIIVEFFVWILGGISANIYAASFVQAAEVASLYTPIKIFGKMIDPTRITKLIRVAYVLTYLTFYTMWCTQGLGTNLAAYTLWRKCAYGLIVFMCAIVNAPLLIIFGGKIIKTMERRFDEAKPRSRGTLMGTESKSVPTKSIAQGERSFANPDSSIKSYANADAHGDHLQKEIRQFKALRLAMQVFIVVVYAGNVIYGLGCILGFELKMTPQGMVILKAVLDFLWFFISGHFNANLFYVEYNRVKRKPTSLSQK